MGSKQHTWKYKQVGTSTYGSLFGSLLKQQMRIWSRHQQEDGGVFGSQMKGVYLKRAGSMHGVLEWFARACIYAYDIAKISLRRPQPGMRPPGGHGGYATTRASGQSEALGPPPPHPYSRPRGHPKPCRATKATGTYPSPTKHAILRVYKYE